MATSSWAENLKLTQADEDAAWRDLTVARDSLVEAAILAGMPASAARKHAALIEGKRRLDPREPRVAQAMETLTQAAGPEIVGSWVRASRMFRDASDRAFHAAMEVQDRDGAMARAVVELEGPMGEMRSALIAEAARINPTLDIKFARELWGEGPALVASGAGGTERIAVAGMYEHYHNLASISLDPAYDTLANGLHEIWHSLEHTLSEKEQRALRDAFPATDRLSHEERVAYAFGDWAAGRIRETDPDARRAFRKLALMTGRVGQSFVNSGLGEAGHVFEKAFGGELGRRAVEMATRAGRTTPVHPPTSAAYALDPDAGQPRRLSDESTIKLVKSVSSWHSAEGAGPIDAQMAEARDAIAAAYNDLIGYDPFKDDPAATLESVGRVLVEYLEDPQTRLPAQRPRSAAADNGGKAREALPPPEFRPEMRYFVIAHNSDFELYCQSAESAEAAFVQFDAREGIDPRGKGLIAQAQDYKIHPVSKEIFDLARDYSVGDRRRAAELWQALNAAQTVPLDAAALDRAFRSQIDSDPPMDTPGDAPWAARYAAFRLAMETVPRLLPDPMSRSDHALSGMQLSLNAAVQGLMDTIPDTLDLMSDEATGSLDDVARRIRAFKRALSGVVITHQSVMPHGVKDKEERALVRTSMAAADRLLEEMNYTFGRVGDEAWTKPGFIHAQENARVKHTRLVGEDGLGLAHFLKAVDDLNDSWTRLDRHREALKELPDGRDLGAAKFSLSENAQDMANDATGAGSEPALRAKTHLPYNYVVVSHDPAPTTGNVYWLWSPPLEPEALLAAFASRNGLLDRNPQELAQEHQVYGLPAVMWNNLPIDPESDLGPGWEPMRQPHPDAVFEATQYLTPVSIDPARLHEAFSEMRRRRDLAVTVQDPAPDNARDDARYAASAARRTGIASRQEHAGIEAGPLPNPAAPSLKSEPATALRLTPGTHDLAMIEALRAERKLFAMSPETLAETAKLTAEAAKSASSPETRKAFLTALNLISRTHEARGLALPPEAAQALRNSPPHTRRAPGGEGR